MVGFSLFLTTGIKEVMYPLDMEAQEHRLDITRSRYVRADVTLDSCEALQFCFASNEGNSHSLVVWKNGPKNIRSADGRKRIRDIRPGDRVFVFGKLETVTAVEIYR